jgi:hypothetical protein
VTRKQTRGGYPLRETFAVHVGDERENMSLAARYSEECHRLTDVFLKQAILSCAETQRSAASPLSTVSADRTSVKSDSSLFTVREPSKTIQPQRTLAALCDAMEHGHSHPFLVSNGEGTVCIDLRHAVLGNWGTVAFFLALASTGEPTEHQPTITAVNLSEAGVRHEGLLAVLRFLASPLGKRVSSVDLSGNDFLAVTSGLHLAAHIHSYPALRHVKLNGTNIPAYSVKQIHAVLAQHES